MSPCPWAGPGSRPTRSIPPSHPGESGQEAWFPRAARWNASHRAPLSGHWLGCHQGLCKRPLTQDCYVRVLSRGGKAWDELQDPTLNVHTSNHERAASEGWRTSSLQGFLNPLRYSLPTPVWTPGASGHNLIRGNCSHQPVCEGACSIWKIPQMLLLLVWFLSFTCSLRQRRCGSHSHGAQDPS